MISSARARRAAEISVALRANFVDINPQVPGLTSWAKFFRPVGLEHKSCTLRLLAMPAARRDSGDTMQRFRLQLTACVRQLDGERYLAETAEFPEISCLRRSRRAAVEAVSHLIRRVARDLTPADLVRRQPHTTPTLDELLIEIDPPRRSAAWERPVALKLSLLKWSHTTDGWIAWIPALGIQVIAAQEAELSRLLPAHVRGYFQRIHQGVTLRQLAELQRTTRIWLLPCQVEVPVKTPQQWQLEADEAKQPQKSVLKEVASDLAQDSGPPVYGRDAAVREAALVLTAQPPRSVLLVGASGVGKTAVVRELARKRHACGLGERRFWSTSGSRLVAGMSCFGMWQERCQHLVEESSRVDAVVHLGSLFELLEVGRSESSGVGIAQFLRLPIVRGKLLAIAEATPEQFQLIERQQPELVQAFDVIRLEPPTRDECREILSAVAAAAPPLPTPPGVAVSKPAPLITPEALAEVDHLHRRYATYSALPGRPLRFLSNLLQDRLQSAQDAAIFVAQTGPPPLSSLTADDVIAAFSRETGLPRWLLDDRAVYDPDAARRQLRQRVKGQDAAVEEVVQWLGLIKAQLIRPQRPLASLLFIGPTGVGKTELAKSLAEILFGDEQRLTRFDMSEFADPWSAQRLIGGAAHAEGLLTSRVREQPFCVLLLDEFEKADASVFDLLLQVLGEARLTDAGGRLADFTNAVIILTSNLGAEAFQRGQAGFVASRTDRQHDFVEAVRQFLRPEMFNRIDRIVPFDPLGTDTIRDIAHLEVERLKQRDGLRFRIAEWNCTPVACDWLAERGYDVRYGARPLKRVIERTLLAPLADRLLHLPAQQRVGVVIDLVNGELNVALSSITQTRPTPLEVSGMPAVVVTEWQRRTAKMAHCPAVRRWQNELVRAKQFVDREHRRMLKRTAVGKPWSPPREHAARQKVVGELESFLERLQLLQQSFADLEDRCWLDVLRQKSRVAAVVPPEELQRLEKEWNDFARELFYRQFADPHRAVLTVFGGDRATLGRLAAGYREVCQSRGWTAREWEYTAVRTEASFEAVAYEDPNDGPLFSRLTKKPADLQALPEHVIGLGWELSGHGCYAELSGEEGIHRFTKDSTANDCAVFISDETMATYRPPSKVGRRSATAKVTKADLRRTYQLATRSILDPWNDGGQAFEFQLDQLGSGLLKLINGRVDHEIHELISATE